MRRPKKPKGAARRNPAAPATSPKRERGTPRRSRRAAPVRRPAGLPLPNTTCDYYTAPTVPPAAPSLAGIAIHLTAVWQAGSEASEGTTSSKWTHVLKCAADVDIRDTYPAGGAANRVYVPDKNGTRFDIVFVELVNRGAAARYRRVFLVRQTPTWPTSEL